jgi:hypothetical protein
MRRIALALAVIGLQAVAANAASVEYIGQNIVPTGFRYAGTTVGGLSGIDYDAAAGRYWVISDDRSQLNPARFYDLTLDLSRFPRSNAPGAEGVTFTGVTNLKTPAGMDFAALTVDPESIRKAGSTLYWSNEGQRTAAGFQNPTVRAMDLAGNHVAEFSVPARFNPSGGASGLLPGDAGIYNNLAFESLALSTDRTKLYVAAENGLAQDTLPVTQATNQPSMTRVVEFDVASRAAQAEYAYQVGPLTATPTPADAFATNGLVEMLAVGDRQFLTVERSFATGVPGNGIRIYYVDGRDATDISAIDTLEGATFTPMTKQLLLDVNTLTNDDGSALLLDNIEGITFGPAYGPYAQTLILVSDNNFSGTQFTQFVALGLTAPIPEPETYALLGVGLALLALRRRRVQTFFRA